MCPAELAELQKRVRAWLRSRSPKMTPGRRTSGAPSALAGPRAGPQGRSRVLDLAVAKEKSGAICAEGRLTEFNLGRRNSN
jgi:hypothetical protein